MKNSTTVKSLREAAWFGFTQEERSTAWLVLLDIISPAPEQQEADLKERCALYASLCAQDVQMHSPEILLSPESIAKVHKQIGKDIMRTHTFVYYKDRAESFRRAMELFSKKYSIVGYVQGMCDIYKVFIDVHSSVYTEEQAEAVSYFCFVRIVSNYLDYFSSRQAGIERSIEEIEHLLAKNRPCLYAHLKKMKVEIKYFAYNWMSTFLFREFLDHKEVFDAHFSLGPEEFIRFNVAFAAGIVVYLQDRILKQKEFEGIVRILQNIQNEPWTKQDIQKLLSISYVIYAKGTLFQGGSTSRKRIV